MNNIGIKVKVPETKKDLAKDEHDPFTGSIKVRGRTFTGTVLSAKMTRTATVSWSRTQYDQKYERYIKKWTKIHAHNPEIINAKKGDVVRLVETRPISKTKNFVIIEVLGTDIESQIKEESRELDAKVKVAKEERRQKRKESEKAQQATSQDDGAASVESVTEEAINEPEARPVEQQVEEPLPADSEEGKEEEQKTS